MLTQTPLRPDIERLVTLRAAETLFGNRDKWKAYEDFKMELSRMCGIQAAPAQRNHNQYNMGVQHFLKLARM
jgi:hypothetical protein